jgi:hypothetical protein
MEPSINQLKEMYEWADSLSAFAPWETLYDDELIAVKHGRHKPVFANTLGGSKITYGVAFYQGKENLEGFWMMQDGQSYGLDSEFILYSQNLLAVYYGEEDEVPLNQLQAMKELGLHYEAGKIPYFISLKQGRFPSSVDADEIEDLMEWTEDYISAASMYFEQMQERPMHGPLECFVMKVTAKSVRYGYSTLEDTFDPGYLLIDDEDFIARLQERGRDSRILEADIRYMNVPVGENSKGRYLERPENPLLVVLASPSDHAILSAEPVHDIAEARMHCANALTDFILDNGAPSEVRFANVYVEGSLANLCDLVDTELVKTDACTAVDDFIAGFREYADQNSNKNYS